MRLQTRLFFGTAALVLALMATQWWLHQRQLRAVETELGTVAAAVGKDILTFSPETLAPELNQVAHGMVRVGSLGHVSGPYEWSFSVWGEVPSAAARLREIEKHDLRGTHFTFICTFLSLLTSIDTLVAA